jgi:hypothetical protein
MTHCSTITSNKIIAAHTPAMSCHVLCCIGCKGDFAKQSCPTFVTPCRTVSHSVPYFACKIAGLKLVQRLDSFSLKETLKSKVATKESKVATKEETLKSKIATKEASYKEGKTFYIQDMHCCCARVTYK